METESPLQEGRAEWRRSLPLRIWERCAPRQGSPQMGTGLTGGDMSGRLALMARFLLD